MPPDGILKAPYPTDLNAALREIYEFFTSATKDYAVLVHGLYQLVGVGLSMVFGQPNDQHLKTVLDVKTMVESANDIGAIPPFLFPLIMKGIELLLSYLSKRLNQ